MSAADLSASRTGRVRNDVDKISTPHGPSKPLSRSTAIRPRQIERPVAAQQPVVDGVLEQVADDLCGGVVQFDTEDHLRRERSPQFVERGACPKHMPGVHQQTDTGMVGGRDDLGAHRHRLDQGERHRLDGDAGSVLNPLVGDFAQRADERGRVGGAGPEVGADLDEGRRQHVGGVEQQVAHMVGVTRRASGNPPSLDQLDLDVGESVVGDQIA